MTPHSEKGEEHQRSGHHHPPSPTDGGGVAGEQGDRHDGRWGDQAGGGESPGGGHKAEFVKWRWEPMKNLPQLIIPFKRPVYERVVKEFARLAGK